MFDLWVGKIPWRKKWQPTPVFLPGEPHGQRSLAGCSLWSCKESDMTEWLTLALFFFFFQTNASVQGLSQCLASNPHSVNKPLSPANSGRFHSLRMGCTKSHLCPSPARCVERRLPPAREDCCKGYPFLDCWLHSRSLHSATSLSPALGSGLFSHVGCFHLAPPLFGMIIWDFVFVLCHEISP